MFVVVVKFTMQYQDWNFKWGQTFYVNIVFRFFFLERWFYFRFFLYVDSYNPIGLQSLPDHEDLMPETVQRRHEQALNEERKKFSTFLKFPWSTRSRANRRIDSRAESSGTNTPDPTSPAAKTPQHLGGDHEVWIAIWC